MGKKTLKTYYVFSAGSSLKQGVPANLKLWVKTFSIIFDMLCKTLTDTKPTSQFMAQLIAVFIVRLQV